MRRPAVCIHLSAANTATICAETVKVVNNDDVEELPVNPDPGEASEAAVRRVVAEFLAGTPVLVVPDGPNKWRAVCNARAELSEDDFVRYGVRGYRGCCQRRLRCTLFQGRVNCANCLKREGAFVQNAAEVGSVCMDGKNHYLTHPTQQCEPARRAVSWAAR